MPPSSLWEVPFIKSHLVPVEHTHLASTTLKMKTSPEFPTSALPKLYLSSQNIVFLKTLHLSAQNLLSRLLYPVWFEVHAHPFKFAILSHVFSSSLLFATNHI